GGGGFGGGTSFPGAMRRRGPRPQRFAGTGGAGGDWRVAERSGDTDGLSVGARVFHQKFGYGRITAKDGDKLEIDFEKAGRKKVMGSFVETVS
ncbi:MAG: DNA helicase II, partial [Rhodospirillaceae bacterium]|nr:DNA helicase II [Rhodospirillaceae bacterium]